MQEVEQACSIYQGRDVHGVRTMTPKRACNPSR